MLRIFLSVVLALQFGLLPSAQAKAVQKAKRAPNQEMDMAALKSTMKQYAQDMKIDILGPDGKVANVDTLTIGTNEMIFAQSPQNTKYTYGYKLIEENGQPRMVLAAFLQKGATPADWERVGSQTIAMQQGKTDAESASFIESQMRAFVSELEKRGPAGGDAGSFVLGMLPILGFFGLIAAAARNPQLVVLIPIVLIVAGMFLIIKGVSGKNGKMLFKNDGRKPAQEVDPETLKSVLGEYSKTLKMNFLDKNGSPANIATLNQKPNEMIFANSPEDTKYTYGYKLMDDGAEPRMLIVAYNTNGVKDISQWQVVESQSIAFNKGANEKESAALVQSQIEAFAKTLEGRTPSSMHGAVKATVALITLGSVLTYLIFARNSSNKVVTYMIPVVLALGASIFLISINAKNENKDVTKRKPAKAH